MARRPSKAKKARKKPAGSRKKRMSKSGKMVRKAAAKPARKPAAKIAAKSAKKPATAGKPAKARKHDPEATVNALVLLVLIMIALGSAFLYMQHQPAGAVTTPPAAGMMK